MSRADGVLRVVLTDRAISRSRLPARKLGRLALRDGRQPLS